MTPWLKKYAFVLILLVLGLGTRFIWIGQPADVVWDEQHFGRFTKGYTEGKYFFDIHPPLGKFLLLGSLKLAGADPSGFDFAIGTPYPENYPYVAARSTTALFGGLLPLLIYLVARALKFSRRASFLVGALVLLDNAIFAESHFALIDIFVPVFGYTALLFFLKHRGYPIFSRASWTFLILAGIFGGLAASVKWTGAGALTVMGAATIIDAMEKKDWKIFLKRALVLPAISIPMYVALFGLHLQLLPDSGPGDAFMSDRFNASIRGSDASERGDVKPLSFLGRFAELNKKMFVVNAGQGLTHPDSSRYYEWPAGRKRIYFWVDTDNAQRRIFLLANPIVWLFGILSFIGGILLLVFRRHMFRHLIMSRPEWREKLFAVEFLFLVYMANWLPFAAVTRAMFLYHYFTSLIASLLFGAFLLFELIPALGIRGSLPEKRQENRYIIWMILLLAAAAFILFSPLSYGYTPFFI